MNRLKKWRYEDWDIQRIGKEDVSTEIKKDKFLISWRSMGVCLLEINYGRRHLTIDSVAVFWYTTFRQVSAKKQKRVVGVLIGFVVKCFYGFYSDELEVKNLGKIDVR